MPETDPALAEEQAHLDRTYAAYEAILRALSVTRRGRQGDEFTEEVLERMRRERLRAYTAASGPLYFGRIDRDEPLYIGRHAIADAQDRLLAINWRAPAAEPFYAATPADARGVVRRRRLDIEDRTVLGYVDERLAGGEDRLTEAIVEDITRQRVGEMRQIISTITPEQYGLITRRVDGALVVQGGPGTGKTAVGLHRAAWLLYAEPALARAGVLVVGPNRVFIAYISQVLPSLGEQSIEQRPIDALVTARPRAQEDPPARAALLGSRRMAELLSRLLWRRISLPEAPVGMTVGRVTVEAAPDELAALVAEGRARGSYQAGRERFRDRLCERLAAEVVERTGDGHRLEFDAVRTAVRRTREYQRLTTRCWPRVTAEALFASLFTNRRRLAAAAGELLSGAELDLLVASPPAGPSRSMTHGEFAVLDEARALVEPDLRTFGHVVVDEAQNLTPMEMRMVVRRARRQSLTVLGDLGQRTVDAGLGGWAAVLGDAGVEHVAIEELLVSYRVPDDFLRLAAAFAPGTRVPQGVRRAPWPAVAVHCDGRAAVAATLARRMAADVGSVGVIVPDVAADVSDALGAQVDEALSAGVNVLGLAAVKGLEFDAAIVVEPGAILAERPDGGRGGLYTALTRSTRALVVVHTEPLPDELTASRDLRRVAADSAAEEWAAGRST